MIHRLALITAAALLSTACSGQNPTSSGWYDLGGGARLRIHAAELGPGCRLIGGDYPEHQLDELGVVWPDPTFAQCDALIEHDGVDIVLSGPEGGVHPAYDDVGLQPLLVQADSMYMSFRSITSPGRFVLTLVHEVDGAEEQTPLTVEAIDPR